jgi:hypothetical protein
MLKEINNKHTKQPLYMLSKILNLPNLKTDGERKN